MQPSHSIGQTGHYTFLLSPSKKTKNKSIFHFQNLLWYFFLCVLGLMYLFLKVLIIFYSQTLSLPHLMHTFSDLNSFNCTERKKKDDDRHHID